MIRATLPSLYARCAPHWTRILNWVERPWRREQTWVDIVCEGTFKPAAWDGKAPLPQIFGSSSQTEFPFWPTNVGVTEIITATFENPSFGMAEQKFSAEVENCGDLVMESVMPAMPGQLFSANRHGLRQVRWPHVSKGIKLTTSFSVEPTALRRITPPDGCVIDDLKEIHIKARVAVWGPRTR